MWGVCFVLIRLVMICCGDSSVVCVLKEPHQFHMLIPGNVSNGIILPRKAFCVFERLLLDIVICIDPCGFVHAHRGGLVTLWPSVISFETPYHVISYKSPAVWLYFKDLYKSQEQKISAQSFQSIRNKRPYPCCSGISNTQEKVVSFFRAVAWCTEPSGFEEIQTLERTWWVADISVYHVSIEPYDFSN